MSQFLSLSFFLAKQTTVLQDYVQDLSQERELVELFYQFNKDAIFIELTDITSSAFDNEMRTRLFCLCSL